MGEISDIDRLRMLAERALKLAGELKALVESEQSKQGDHANGR